MHGVEYGFQVLRFAPVRACLGSARAVTKLIDEPVTLSERKIICYNREKNRLPPRRCNLKTSTKRLSLEVCASTLAQFTAGSVDAAARVVGRAGA